jgi:hypothetical protein
MAASEQQHLCRRRSFRIQLYSDEVHDQEAEKECE